jgi:hypothetical protein
VCLTRALPLQLPPPPPPERLSLCSAFMVDRFHATAHKCSPAVLDCAPAEVNNTPVVEQFNRHLRRIEPSLRRMKPFHAMQLLRLFAVFHNWLLADSIMRRVVPTAAVHEGFAAAGAALAGVCAGGAGGWGDSDDD